MKIEIQLAKFEEKHLLKRMLELYFYDFSGFEENDLNEFGEYGYRYFDHYWTETERHPFIVKVDGKLAGFVFVNRFGYTKGVEQTIAEFCILRKYRQKGIGKRTAFYIFDQFPGIWEIRTQKENKVAQAFWSKVISEYSNESMKEFKDGTCDWNGPLWTFESKTKTEHIGGCNSE